MHYGVISMKMDLLGEYSSSSEDEREDEKDKHDDEAATPISTKTTAVKVSQGHVKLIDSSNAATSDLFVREIPHTRGNWAGHVFVDISTSDAATRSVTRFCRLLETVGWSGTVVSSTQNLHLSLSRPFFLQECFIEPFVKALQERLANEQSTRLFVTGETLLVNDSGTRSFWCWDLSNNTILLRILNHVNVVLQHYQQQAYFENPKFHVSVASLAGNVSNLFEQYNDQEKANAATSSSAEIANEDADDSRPVVISVDHVNVTFGTTKSFRINLS